MTAAPERRIDIVTARLDGQSLERLICEHRDVLDHTPDSLQRQRVELRRQVRRSLLALQHFFEPLAPARLVPQLEAVALTDQHPVALEARELTQLGRE